MLLFVLLKIEVGIIFPNKETETNKTYFKIDFRVKFKEQMSIMLVGSGGNNAYNNTLFDRKNNS